MLLSQFKDILNSGRLNEALSYLEKNGLELGSKTTLLMKKNKDLSDRDKEKLTKLVAITLFEPDQDKNIQTFVKQKHFGPQDIINILIKYEDQYVAASHIRSINDGEALLLCLTVVISDTYDLKFRGRGFYGLLMAIKYFYALVTGCKYIMGRTQNPLALEQYDKHGLFFNPNLYYEIHKGISISPKQARFLIGKAQEIYKKSNGILLSNDLMVNSDQVDSAAYKSPRQPARNQIINTFVDKYNKGERFFAIRIVDETILPYTIGLINHFQEKENIL
jgi:hypothetical protein